MKLEYLKEFMALSEYLNYTLAAEQLFITQPALSRHIASVERELGAQLFQRDTQHVELTDFGRSALEEIGTIVNTYEHLRRRVELEREGVRRVLRVGVPYYAIRDYMGNVPARFERAYPHIRLIYVSGDQNEVVESLFQSRADVIVVPKLPFPRAETLSFRPLAVEPLGVLINRADPLSERASLTLEELRNEPFLDIDDSVSAAGWDQLRRLCRRAGFEPKEPTLVNQVETALLVIRRGDGVMVAGRHMRALADEAIAYVPLEGAECSRSVCLCCRKDAESDAVRRLAEMFETERAAL